ncbi:MAG: PhzF family phenazine biosynthesis protein [Acidobacteria bacterium]|nr:MAG: PhzF family phenazine biosynthesis protein [Acidobacteriota bacterium]
MRKLRYRLLDVFTNRAFGGNQLAVFTDVSGLSSQTMQSIARELNLSETTFVLQPEDRANDYRVRIFAPALELPMAGHPTIGTSFVLAMDRLVERSERINRLKLEEGVGTIAVNLEWENGHPAFIEMTQPLPTFGSHFEDASAVSCGVPFLFVPLRDLETVRGIRFRLDVWERVLRDFEAPHVFVFTRETEAQGSTVHSRMFAPASGISEDPATGGASGPLGCYLVRHKVLSPARLTECVSEQGMEMGRPSFIKIRIEQNEEGEISAVRVGGRCHSMGEGYLGIDE